MVILTKPAETRNGTPPPQPRTRTIAPTLAWAHLPYLATMDLYYGSAVLPPLGAANADRPWARRRAAVVFRGWRALIRKTRAEMILDAGALSSHGLTTVALYDVLTIAT